MTLTPQTQLQQQQHFADQLRQAETQLHHLTATAPAVDQLIAQAVNLMGSALNAAGAAIWVTDNPDRPNLILEHQLSNLKLIDGGKAVAGVMLAVRRSAREGKPLIVPPMFSEQDQPGEQAVSNPSHFELLYVPMRLHNRPAMVLAMAVQPSDNHEIHRMRITFLQRMLGMVEVTMTERHLSLMEKDRGIAANLVEFSQQIHKRLLLNQVAIDLANLSRALVQAERVSVELYPRLRRKITAVSNVDEPNKRSALFQAQRLIFDYVRDRALPVSLDRQDVKTLVNDPALQDAASGYFAASNFAVIVAEPIIEESSEGPRVIGVVLAEFTRSDAAHQREAMLRDIAHLSIGAVTNAIEYEAIPFRRALYAVSQLWRKPTSTRKKVMATVAGGIFLVLLILGIIPFDFSVRADCKVQPMAQLSIVAPMEGRIIDVPVRAGEHVYPPTGRKDDGIKPLAVFDTTDLLATRAEQQQKLAELGVALKEAQTKGEIAKIGAAQLQVKQVEDQLKLLNHQIEKATVYSPIEGTVLTENVEHKKWSTVRLGDPLMEVASFNDWNLIVEVPESEVAAVRGALDRSARRSIDTGKPDEGIEVEYILYPWPDQKLSVHAKGVATLLPAASQSKDANVFRLQVQVNLQDLPPGIAMSGVTGRAKLHVGKKPLITQWTRGARRLINMTLLF